MLKKSDIEKFIVDLFQSKIRSDIIDNETNYTIICEVPGIKKENISIEYSNNILTIFTTEPIKHENLIKSERSNGLSIRSFNIPNINIEDSVASLNDGILKIILPKSSLDKDCFILNII